MAVPRAETNGSRNHVDRSDSFATLMMRKSVRLRKVTEEDLPIFFDHQRDPIANRMAAFTARDLEAFMDHWATKVLGDDTVTK